MTWSDPTRTAEQPAAEAGQQPRPRESRRAGPEAGARTRLRAPKWASFLCPKGNLTKTELRLLGLLALAPLVTILLRLMALPGVVGPGLNETPLDFIRNIGNTLNQTFSLSAVPASQRDHVVYLLFIPTCAMLIALARLTFGIRVLGFRSILIAVGFHESGIIPSLLLIGIVVVTIVAVRPWLKRTGMPYYARVSVILCIVAMTMVGALLAGPWMRSSVLWGAAYFPVIVLGMLAEGIAGTLDRDNMLAASWRATTTIILAFLIALLGRVPALRETLLQFPEIALTEIVAIILIAEFLDFRLLQDWDAKVAGMALPKLLADAKCFRVAVVRNHASSGIVGRLGLQAPRKHLQHSVQKIVDALRSGGHTVRVMEGDMSLLGALRQFMPSNPRTGQPGGIVLNLAHGIQGDGRYTHVPAMLEMSGIAYTGATPWGHALALDRMAAKTLMQQAGIPTPAFCLMTSPADDTRGLRYPLSVRPRREPGCRVAVVKNRKQLERVVRKVIRRYGQDAVVEERIAGRRFNVALLGNDPVETLPLVEVVSGRKDKICPATIDKVYARRILDVAKATFRVCGCRDYARIDIRFGETGTPYIIGVGTIGILDRGGSFAQAGAQAGYSYSKLLCRIIEVARARYLTDRTIRPVRRSLPAEDGFAAEI